MGRKAKEREFIRKHILPILLILLMILLVGCSKSSELPQNTEISSSSVGQFSELKQDENLTDEPSIIETESAASSTENKVVSEPAEIQEKEDKKPAYSSESKPTEEIPKTTEKTKNKSAETKPAETQQTEPTQPTTNPTEKSKEPENESEPETVYQVPERSEVETLVAAYINQYRSTKATVLSGLTSVARYRSNQLVTNFVHTDGIDACNALQYGEFVDMTLYGMNESDSYYQGYNREAIAKGNWTGTVDEIAQRIANGFKNSSSHWSYLGSSEYSYIAVGCTYDEASSIWYCCICVSSKNYGG